MASPEISLVIPFFREGELLREAMECALGQTAGDVETVLVDNNADPDSRRVAMEFSGRYPKSVRLVHESLQGACASRNRGLREARGRFVAFLDGDDLMDPDRLRLQREAFLENPGTALVSAWYDRVSMDNRSVVRRNVSETEPSIWLESQKILRDLYPAGPGSGSGSTLHFPLLSTTFFERETALSAGGFEDRLNPRWFEDIEFYLRMYKKGEFLKIPRSLVRYRSPSPEAAEVKRRQMDWVGMVRHMDLFYRIVEENFGRSPRIFRRIAALWLRHESLNFFRYRDGRSLGIRMLERSLRADPASLSAWKLWVKAHLPQKFYPGLFWFPGFMEGALPPGADRTLVEGLFSPIPGDTGTPELVATRDRG